MRLNNERLVEFAKQAAPIVHELLVGAGYELASSEGVDGTERRLLEHLTSINESDAVGIRSGGMTIDADYDDEEFYGLRISVEAAVIWPDWCDPGYHVMGTGPRDISGGK